MQEWNVKAQYKKQEQASVGALDTIAQKEAFLKQIAMVVENVSADVNNSSEESELQ
ncbi:hypothetical protein [Cohnella sp. AR92]|uniref:hypothetical protein n=1 Tax=Cohnella sp. AR92 TaxID=648716 RepID=UPI0013151543|nr:hypothetical protein [Cohnella sp. AR92]